MRKLNSTFVTPFDRADIYALASVARRLHRRDGRRRGPRSCSTSSNGLPAGVARAGRAILGQQARAHRRGRCRELRSMKGLDDVLGGDQPAGERGRPDLPDDARRAVRRGHRRDRACSRPRRSSTSWSRRRTPSRRSRTTSRRSRSRRAERPVTLTLALVILVVAVALVFDYTNGFHDAANAIATSVSTGALTPRVALLHGRRLQPRRRPARRGRGEDDRQRHHQRRRAATTGSSSCSPGCSGAIAWNLRHLVARPALVVVPRAHRRPHRRRPRLGDHRALGR